jgi:pyruvate/2-oxoglutarate dehydrogenase complex dihydrolipoamide acyltransferase (E2) component
MTLRFPQAWLFLSRFLLALSNPKVQATIAAVVFSWLLTSPFLMGALGFQALKPLVSVGITALLGTFACIGGSRQITRLISLLSLSLYLASPHIMYHLHLPLLSPLITFPLATIACLIFCYGWDCYFRPLRKKPSNQVKARVTAKVRAAAVAKVRAAAVARVRAAAAAVARVRVRAAAVARVRAAAAAVARVRVRAAAVGSKELQRRFPLLRKNRLSKLRQNWLKRIREKKAAAEGTPAAAAEATSPPPPKKNANKENITPSRARDCSSAITLMTLQKNPWRYNQNNTLQRIDRLNNNATPHR